jgi:hypothetical protein
MTDNDLSRITADLRKLYLGEDEDYRSFFDIAAQRQRRRWATDVESIRTMLMEKTTESARIVAKEMRRIGVGKFINNQRVEWFFRLDTIGQVARGDHDDLLDKQAEANANNVSKLQELDDESPDEDYLSHAFRLRLDKTITVNLPSDLTVTEADRLADFVKSLPFNRDF